MRAEKSPRRKTATERRAWFKKNSRNPCRRRIALDPFADPADYWGPEPMHGIKLGWIEPQEYQWILAQTGWLVGTSWIGDVVMMYGSVYIYGSQDYKWLSHDLTTRVLLAQQRTRPPCVSNSQMVPLELVKLHQARLGPRGSCVPVSDRKPESSTRSVGRFVGCIGCRDNYFVGAPTKRCYIAVVVILVGSRTTAEQQTGAIHPSIHSSTNPHFRF